MDDKQPFVSTHVHSSDDPFRLLVEAVKDYGIFMLDPQGNVTSWNPGAQKIKGYTAEEIIGRPFSCFYTAADIAAGTPQRELQAAFEEGHFEEEGLRLRKDGSSFCAIVTITTIRDSFGGHRGYANVTRDITERKAVVEMLRTAHAAMEQQVIERTAELTFSNHALEAANLTKDRFLSSMSHELRTPLNAIIGFTGTLLMKLPGPLTPDQDKQLQIIQRSSHHLLALINDILDLAKIESGTTSMPLEPVVCQPLIAEVAITLRPLAEQKGLHLIVDCPVEPCTVQVNRRALSQILLNLVNNAIKFTEHGSVRVTLAQQETDGQHMVEIAIADSGIGIDVESQAHLFQQFTQLAGSNMGRQEGTGLGLHLSQKLAGLLGGQITVQSAAGQGSIFTLHLAAA